MKKILALILALVLCLSSVALLASCKDPSQGGTEPGPGTATYDVEAAKDYVKSLYTKYLSNNKTNGDFKLVNQVKQGDVVYTVTWTSDNEAVKVVETEGEATVTIDVPEKPAEDVNYTLKATVTAPDGATASLEFKLLVPKFDQDAGFEDYIAAEKGDAVTVEGIVTSITSKSQGGKYNNLYVQDLNGAGGYYIYSIKDGVDPVADLGIKLGMTVEVSGTKDIYNGTHEVKDAVVTVTDTTEKEIEFIDLTDKALAAENAEDFDLVNYQGCWVTLKGVVIGGVYADQYYYYWSIGNVDSYTRLALSCGLPEATIDAIKNGHTAHKGYTATVKGIVNVYNGVFYLVPLGEDAFVYGEKLEVTDDQKVADEKADLTVKDKFTTESSLTLPVAGATHEDVTIAWTSSDTSVLTIAADGKVTFVAAGTATLTATITANGVTDTKTFDVTVESTGFNPVKPVVGTAYKLAMFQEMAGKIVYMNGEESGYYLATTTDFASAIDFFIEETKDGFYVYTTIAGAKKYLNMEVSADGAHVNAKLQDTAVTVYTYNETIKTMSSMVDGVEYVFGTRNDNTYETVGCNKLSYNPFMVVFVTDAGTPDQGGDDPVTPPSTGDGTVKPVAGKPYKLGMVQEMAGKTVFMNGEVSGYYLATTTDKAAALDFYIEETTGGFYIYATINGAKKYLNMEVSADGAHVNAKLQDTKVTVYTWDDAIGTVKSSVNGEDYVFGTRNDNTYETVGCNKLSYNPFMVKFYGEGEGSGTVTPPVDGDGDGDDEPQGNELWTLVQPVVGKGYKFGVYQGSNKKYIYINGNMVNTYYFASTTNYDSGIDVFIEETTGGYYMYYMKNGTTKTYINCVASGSYVNAKYQTTPSSVWTWNASKKMLTTKVNGTEYTLGTYSSYDSISPVKVTQTSNFFGGFVEIVITEPDPEGDTPLTLEEVNEIALNRNNGQYSENKYVVTGRIIAITNSTTGILTIVDAEGNTFKINGTYYPYYTSANQWNKIPADQRPGIGDTVSFYGVIGNASGTGEMKNASIIDGWVRHTCDMSPATCEDPATCKLCGKQEGLTYVHVVEDCECTVCGTAVHIFRDGECIDCGELDSVKNVTISFSSTANRTEYSTSIQVWEQNGIKVTNNKAASTSNVGNYSNPARFYASSNLVIEAKGIKVIKFTCSSTSYATALKNSIGTSNGTVVVSGSTVTWTLPAATNSVTIAKFTAQVRVSSITVNP